MKLKNVFIVMIIMMVGFFLAQTVIILNNNETMKNINIALRSNTDAVLVEANIRGFSTHIHATARWGESALKLQKLYMSYADSVENFKKIVAEIESGESKRPQTEISEELAAHKKTLSDAVKLSGELKLYLAEQKQNITEGLFDDVFESSTMSLELDNKHANELREENNVLLHYVFNITFLLIVLGIVIVALGSFIIFSKIITPIIRLTKIIEDVSMGKLAAEIGGKERKDEIGDLARAFERTMVSMKMAMKRMGAEKKEEEKNK